MSKISLMADTSVAPNWYPDPQNPALLRWWDGQRWTDQTQPTQPKKAGLGGLLSKGMEAAKEKVSSSVQGVVAGQQDSVPADTATGVLYAFTSHIAGKNAKVEIYADRVEWERPRGISGGKITAAVLTAGLSLAATGVKSNKNAGTEMIPIKAISSVTTRRDGVINSIVSVICGGNTIDFRCGHAEAEQAKSVLTQLVLGNHPSQTAATTQTTPPVVVQVQAPQAAQSAPTDPMEQLTKLKSLLDAGILSQDEFDAKKAQILAQI